MKSNIYDDDYLLMLVHENHDDAIEDFYFAYQKLIIYKANKYRYTASKLGLELSDLIQEGYIGLSQAISDYAYGFNASFRTFANLCIEREIQNAIAAASRKKHQHLNDAIAFESESPLGLKFEDSLGSDSLNPEMLIYNKVMEKSDCNLLKSTLSKIETEVFELAYLGYTYQEIAKILDKTPKCIDNALQRIKRKVHNMFDYT